METNHIPIVGIGASAGGLDAFKQLFQAMPSDPGIAFILVQHLDPNHESLMVDLLSCHTNMSIIQAEDRMKVEPNHVYIIPPNSDLAIENGELHLTSFVKKRGMRMPIDFFFRTLAEDQGERAICIILSGTGSDGTLGLKQIKDHGGMVIVQSPEEAQYDGMPQNAILTGAADFVLPVNEMPEKIINYVNHPCATITNGKDASSREAPSYLNNILSILQARTGHNFSHYKKSSLLRRINKRMSLKGIEELSDYMLFLRQDSDEPEELFQDLLIGVTSFFRDMETWDVLFDSIWKSLLEYHHQDKSPIRVWIPGCSSGEEAYTLAMQIHRKLNNSSIQKDFTIFATDIDKQALDLARFGRYPESISADIPYSYLNSYFDHSDGFYTIKSMLRDHIVFSDQNLICDPPFSKLDLISCRNLMIYLDNSIQNNVINLFHFALNTGGYLLLGSSENVGSNTDLFKTINKKHRVFKKVESYSKNKSPFPVVHDGKKWNGHYFKYPSLNDKKSQAKQLNNIVESSLLQEFAPPSILVNRKNEIVYTYGNLEDYLQFPEGAPTLELFSVLRKGLHTRIRTAIKKAATEKQIISVKDASVLKNEIYHKISFTVKPIISDDKSSDLILICFHSKQEMPVGDDASTASQCDEPIVQQLEYELNATREDLKHTIEELEYSNEKLKAYNEEAMSMNEELQASNEELETSKEELQSLNEELNTVNSQLQEKVDQLETANDNITNLILCSDVVSIFLSPEMDIKFFTPAARNLFKLIESDVGRPLEDIGRKFEDDDLMSDAEKVIEDLKVSKKTLKAFDGRYYRRILGPYRTRENKIEGVVLTFQDVTDLVNYQQQLEQSNIQLKSSEEQLENIIANSPFPMILHAEDGEVLLINKVWEQITGYNHNDIPTIQEWTGKAYCGEEINNVRANIIHLFETEGMGNNGEFVITTKNGDKRTWDFYSSNIDPLPDGRKLVLSIASDITDRKRMEKEVLDSRNKYYEILESINDGFFSLKNDLTVTYFNTAAENLLGRSKKKVLGQKLFDAFPEARGSIFEERYTRAIKEKNYDSFEVFFGENPFENWYSVSIYPSGKGIAVYFKVITEQKKAEAEINKSVENFRQMFDNTNLAMLIIDPVSGIIENTNKAAIAFYGYSEKELIGLDISEIFTSAELTESSYQSSCIRNIIENKNVETTNKLSDGRLCEVEIFSNSISYEGKPKVFLIINDITLRKHATMMELKYREQEQHASIGRIAGKMAHDFNNLLGVILGTSELLLLNSLPSDIQEDLTTIKESAMRGRSITRNLLFFAKEQSLHLEKFDINNKISSILRALSNELEGINVEIEYGDCLENTIADPGMLDSVITNLIQNSIHAIGKTENPSLFIKTSCGKSGFSVEIRDNGCGIPEEASELIFKPSFTLKGSSDKFGAYSSNVKGSGYGLANAKKCIDKLGGKINFESRIKEGTTFRIEIPSLKTCSDDSEDDINSNHAIDKGRKILIVEDLHEFAKILSKALDITGNYSTVASTGTAALKCFKNEKFDAISLDYILPDMDGIEVYKKIRRMDKDIPIIFVSGNFEFMQSMIDLKKEDSKVDHLPKPFNYVEYLNKIGEWIR